MRPDPNSLLYWYPQIKGLVPTPRTVIVPIEGRAIEWLDSKPIPESLKESFLSAGRQIGYPLFLRTDILSGKHRWKDTCHVASEGMLMQHVGALVEESYMPFGVPEPSAFVFRELLDGHAPIRAFWGQMPVSRERRYFARNGDVLCHHPYWFVEAIEASGAPVLDSNDHPMDGWQGVVNDLSKETDEEINELTSMAAQASQALPERVWSIDFMWAERWYLIDMAVAQRSWHPEACPVAERNYSDLPQV